jgi:hypothetical protein
VAVEARLLDDRADAGERLGAPLRNRQTEQTHLAGARPSESEQRSDQRGLPGSVRAEVAEGDAARNGQADVVDDGSMAEALGQPFGLDN